MVDARGSALLDTQRLRLVPGAAPAEAARPPEVRDTEVLVAGGSLGGVAAALGACESGRRVILTEEGDWVGGQGTAQAVSALDENPYVGHFGSTRLYARFRQGVRSYYSRRYRLSDKGRALIPLDPGRGWVTELAAEPAAMLASLEALLQPYVHSGRLTVLTRWKPCGVERVGDSVRGVLFRHLDSERHLRVTARCVLDGTDLGDLLPLARAEYVTGFESRAMTGEPDAPARARPDESQPFSYAFILAKERQPAPPVPAPPEYRTFRAAQPYSLMCPHGDQPPTLLRMYPWTEKHSMSFWCYRRLLDAALFDDPAIRADVALILWYSNDYRDEPIIDRPPAAVLATLRRARHVSLGFAHWLQAEAPRPGGPAGYPELRLRPDETGTADGIARFPYVRESRRIVPLRRLREQDIGVRFQHAARSAPLADTVCVAYRGIDIHPGRPGSINAAQKTKPFQIPLGALIPQRVDNLLPASKNLGTTHMTNGACRMHEFEWSIGEAAGRLAAFCAGQGITPRRVAAEASLLHLFQRRLVYAGVPIYWFADVRLNHPAFAAVQILGARGLWPGRNENLFFHPGAPITLDEARRLLGRTPPAQQERILAAAGLTPEHPVERGQFAKAWVHALGD